MKIDIRYLLLILLFTVVMIVPIKANIDPQEFIPGRTSTIGYKLVCIENIEGYFVENKFGYNPQVDDNTDPEDIWSQGGTYTYLSADTTLYLSSSDNADTVEITVVGCDDSFVQITQTKDLTGQTQVALDTDLMRVWRAYNSDSTDLAGDIYIAESDTLTGGVPDTASKIKAKIDAFAQQTLMTHYTIPDGYTGFLTNINCAISGRGVTTNLELYLAVREEGGVFRDRLHFSVAERGSSFINYEVPCWQQFPEHTDLKLVALRVGANSTAISGNYQMLMKPN